MVIIADGNIKGAFAPFFVQNFIINPLTKYTICDIIIKLNFCLGGKQNGQV